MKGSQTTVFELSLGMTYSYSKKKDRQYPYYVCLNALIRRRRAGPGYAQILLRPHCVGRRLENNLYVRKPDVVAGHLQHFVLLGHRKPSASLVQWRLAVVYQRHDPRRRDCAPANRRSGNSAGGERVGSRQLYRAG